MKKEIKIRRARGDQRSFDDFYDAAKWVFGKTTLVKSQCKSQLFWERALRKWEFEVCGRLLKIRELESEYNFKNSNKTLISERHWIQANGY